MKNINRATMISVGLLLVSVLIATVVLSGTIAKFTSVGTSSDSARVAKWGMEVTAHSDVSTKYGTFYEKNEKGEDVNVGVVASSNSANLIAPGTKGYLTCFRIKGSPEAAYEIDFDGTFSAGAGFTAAQRFVRDERGLAIEYFPIIIRVYTIDQLVEDEDNARVDIGTFAYPSDLGELNTNITNTIKSNFDTQTTQDPGNIDKLYIVEWEWLFTPDDEYQNNDRDVMLAEAIKDNKNNDLFKIKLDMSVKISQVD